MNNCNVLVSKLLTSILLAFALCSAPTFADELKDISQLAEQGQQEQALERINTYLTSNPKDAQALFMKGIILAESGKRDDAIKAFTDLTQKYPNLPEPYNNLAVLYAETGQYELAKKSLETAIKTHPSYAIAHENLGDIYARMASEAYNKALQLDGGNSRAQSKLALIKDLFGTGNTTTTSAKPTTAASLATPNPANKQSNMPIRPAEKKVDTAKTTETDKAPMLESNPEQSILLVANDWATAWSNKDLNKYFNSYADSFTPANGESRKAWEQSRRDRISKPSKISVELSNQKVTLQDANNAKLKFKQSYRADGKPIRTDKTLVMKKVNGIWLIDKEIASN